MSRFNCRTRGNASPQGKPNVYFCCHPADVSCFDEIAGDILRFQNCAIWYREDPARPEDISADSCPADPDTYFCDLSRMQLFVIPVTSSFLCEPNRARDTDLPYALEHHIPILPLLQEDGLESLFNQTCGDLQILNKYTEDPTALDFYQKLERFLSDVLIPDDLADKIRAAFDAYVFLSYRKKDRKYAQQLMRLIHQNEFCRDIAIWYDEFLIPGENFNDSIAAALEQSSLFALAVTPNLVNEPNYVMSIEYPMAKEAKKTVLPFELVPTDKKDLEEKFTELPACTDVRDMSALSATLLEAVTSLAIRENDASPEHLFFIGLAYLAGIDVEVDCEQALALISRAAGQGLPEAMEKLVHMYKNGIGVPRDFLQAISWQKRLIQAKRRQYAAAPSSAGSWPWRCWNWPICIRARDSLHRPPKHWMMRSTTPGRIPERIAGTRNSASLCSLWFFIVWERFLWPSRIFPPRPHSLTQLSPGIKGFCRTQTVLFCAGTCSRTIVIWAGSR